MQGGCRLRQIMRRQLIINADDFGMTRGINLAVSECADFGCFEAPA